MFPELTIVGAPYERGRQYGAAVAPLVRHSIASYARLFAHRRGLDWAASQAEALRFVPLLADLAPDLLEEMRGIADGARLDLAEIVALNVRTELMAGVGSGVLHPDGPAALARNRAAGVPEHPSEDDRRPPAERGAAAPDGTGALHAPLPTAERGAAAPDHTDALHAPLPTAERGAAAPERTGALHAPVPTAERGAAAPERTGALHAPVRPSPQATDDGECTTAAALGPATADGGALLAQTWDWQGDQRAACVLLRIQAPGEPTALTMTEAGIVAKVGLNNAGLAVSLNLLRSHADGQEVGMPVHILLRKMLQCRSFAEAQALTALAPAGGSSCVTLASAEGRLVSLEITPGGVGLVEPEGGLLAHANHCVDDLTMAGECPLEPISTSRERSGRAWELLRAGAGAIDVAALQAILRDHDGDPRCICRHPNMSLPAIDRGESVCGIVIDLGARVMHVAPDVPCTVAFTAVGV